MYNDRCWKGHSPQGMAGAMDKVGDDTSSFGQPGLLNHKPKSSS